ncbi:hypothetical protein AAIA72_12855 [Hahella sp. SMD15-11]|uniref:Secreted protein n=1 Tax=Thermohahella caldifontis TaxID=3142973 RepID=A0AB39UV39_9GAMM
MNIGKLYRSVTKPFCSVALVALSMSVPSQAHAWAAYLLRDNHWAIECMDGTLWSYNGSGNGLSTVGPALCADHGGLAGPGGSTPQVVKAPGEVRRVVEGGCTDPVFSKLKLPGQASQCRGPGKAHPKPMGASRN